MPHIFISSPKNISCQLNPVREARHSLRIFAKSIIEAAKKGERDPERLCANALGALGVVRRYS